MTIAKTYFSLLFISLIVGTTLLVAIFPRGVRAAGEHLSISEVAWMGSSVSSDDEWIELHNTGSEAVNLSGFVVSAQDGTPRLVVSTSTCANTHIEAGGYFLLERTDDESVPAISADCIYSGSLENGGEALSIIDSASSTVYSVDASAGWLAGNNTTKQTMQWNGGEWITATATPRSAFFVGGTITGLVFNDANVNKIREAGELGVSDWKARLFIYPNAPWKEGVEGMAEQEVETDASGNFIFENIPAGRYQVFMEERDGWRTQTQKRTNLLPITLSAMQKTELAITYDITAQMMLGCVLKTTPCSKDLHKKLLDYRYFGVQVDEGEVVSGVTFANSAL
jgi:hypothetical protein